ncbi:hypothetical protein CPB86DRAFT_72722 [Serendipita vermifera]|nr:hypothetical protein CPB86DRAFT_72722 [Serendipita vermifera]
MSNPDSNPIDRQITQRPIPKIPHYWHKRGINNVKISPDGTLIASASEHRRVLVSDASSGDVLYELHHVECVHALCWLRPGPRWCLASGCKYGNVTFFTFGKEGQVVRETYRQFSDLVRMLEFDRVFDRLLVCLTDSITICNLGLEDPASGDNRDMTYVCTSEIGGVGFLTGGNRCVLTVPKESKMEFLVL